MKKFKRWLLKLPLSFLLFAACSHNNDLVKSPNGKINVKFEVSETGELSYTIFYNDSALIMESPLGLVSDHGDFSRQMKLLGQSAAKEIKDNYTLWTGKKSHILYKANERRFKLENNKGTKMDIVFRVSDDGVAFRYEFPEKDALTYTLLEEKTTYHFFPRTKAWLQPLAEVNTGWAGVNPSYEEHYLQDIPVGRPCPTRAGWAYPALFKYKNKWMLISEAGVEKTHCATRLGDFADGGVYTVAFPMPEEVFTGKGRLSSSTLPWKLPWRTMAIGDLGTIVESTLGTDVAAPLKLEDTSWIKPGKASWSWVLLKDASVVYDVQKQFVDYAADMNWEYCLVDAYWDETIGYEKIAELSKYALSKNVGLLLWYNSSGDWNSAPQTPKSKLLTHEMREKEFARLQKMGIKGIKVDFFGGDGQSMIAYYEDIIKDAAKYHLLVNCHGATLPRGIQRTYPNLVSMESIKGFEFVTFLQANADVQPNHCCMIPFTRNVFDPMDFTPMCFSEVPGINRVTSNGFELALSVLFTSGVQHFAETAEGMKQVPEFVQDILKNFPSTWDDTKFIDGYPGKLAVLARKSGHTWYVAGINGENLTKNLKLDVSKLGNNLKGVMVEDGEDNRTLVQKNVEINTATPLEINLQEYGGFLAVLSDISR